MISSKTKRDEIKKQILEWLSQEKDWKVPTSGEDAVHGYYFSCRVELPDGTSCNVGIEQETERVNIITNVLLPIKDIVSNRIHLDSVHFLDALEFNLSERKVQVVPTPDIENVDSLQLAKVIYFHEWSYDKFISAVHDVIDAIRTSEDLFRRFSTAGNQ